MMKRKERALALRRALAATASASRRSTLRLRGRLAQPHEPSEAALARTDAHLALNRIDQALAVVSEASATWPDDEAIVRRHLQVARAVGDLDHWQTALERMVGITPDDPGLQFQQSVLANQLGDAFLYWRSMKNAERLFHERALHGDTRALCGLLRTRRQLGQQESVGELLGVVVAEAHRRPAAPVIDEATETLVAMGDITGLAFLADGIDPKLLDEAGSVSMADLLVRLERHTDALALVDTLGTGSKRKDELQAWAAVRRGEIDQARVLIKELSFPKTLNYLRIYDTTTPLNLELCGQPPPTDGHGPIVITMTKNERSRLPEWFAHYRALGIERFIAIDNGSVDGTLDYLQAQPDTSVFRSETDFRRYASGRRWVNHLIDTYGRNRWCFVVDADELLVFPGDHEGINSLVQRLDGADAQAMFGIALDMHAEHLGAWNDTIDLPLRERFPYFDARTRLIGSRHAPYLAASGGLRNHKLGQLMPENLLYRPVAVRGGSGTHFLNPHATNPALPAPITAALLHYKFAVTPHSRLGIPSAKGVFMQFLGQDLDRTRELELRSAHSVRYEDSAQLERLGILRNW